MSLLSKKFEQKGFTLIELLIVIAIVGILAGFVVVVLNPTKQQARAKDGVAVATLNKIHAEILTSSNTDISGSGNYPSCDMLVSNLQNASVISTCGAASASGNIAISGVTTGDATGFRYIRDNTSNPKRFCVSTRSNEDSTTTTADDYIVISTTGYAPIGVTNIPTKGATACP